MHQLMVVFYKFMMVVTKLILKLVPPSKPTTYAGAGSSVTLVEAMAQMDVKNTLIVTDKVLHELGVLDGIKKAFADQGVNCVIYDGVLPDPTFAVVNAGLAKLREHKCDSVLAVGGGSSIDAAKIIALAEGCGKAPEKLEGLFKAGGTSLPLFAVPTTSGTGSEVTMGAVISHPDKKSVCIDPNMVPMALALDADLFAGMPKGITAATGMDALTHAIEAYVSKFANSTSDVYAKTAVKLVFKYLQKAYDDGSDKEARNAMGLAAYYGGLSINIGLVGNVHAIAHQFGGRYHTPHGLANAIVLPHVLDFNKTVCAARLAELAVACEMGEASEPNSVLADKFIAAVIALNDHMGIPKTLDALKLEDISGISDDARKETGSTYPVPRYMTDEECQGILRKLLPAAQ